MQILKSKLKIGVISKGYRSYPAIIFDSSDAIVLTAVRITELADLFISQVEYMATMWRGHIEANNEISFEQEEDCKEFINYLCNNK